MSIEVVTVTEVEKIVQQEPAERVVEIRERVVRLTEARQGPPGPPGPPGGGTLQRTTGTTLPALVVVYEQDGEVFALDKGDDAHIDQLLGLTVTAASIGGPINVQRTGAVDNSGWAWTPGRVYLGAGGALTQTPATDGNDVLIGRAVSATRLLLDIQDPIDLE